MVHPSSPSPGNPQVRVAMGRTFAEPSRAEGAAKQRDHLQRSRLDRNPMASTGSLPLMESVVLYTEPRMCDWRKFRRLFCGIGRNELSAVFLPPQIYVYLQRLDAIFLWAASWLRIIIRIISYNIYICIISKWPWTWVWLIDWCPLDILICEGLCNT